MTLCCLLGRRREGPIEGHGRLPEAVMEKARKHSPRSPQKGMQLSRLQNCQRIHLDCGEPPRWGACILIFWNCMAKFHRVGV